MADHASLRQPSLHIMKEVSGNFIDDHIDFGQQEKLIFIKKFFEVIEQKPKSRLERIAEYIPNTFKSKEETVNMVKNVHNKLKSSVLYQTVLESNFNKIPTFFAAMCEKTTDTIATSDELMQRNYYQRYLIDPIKGLTLSDAIRMGRILLVLSNPSYEAISLLLSISATDMIFNGIYNYLPVDVTYITLFTICLRFFCKKADELEAQYVLWIETNDAQYFHPIFDRVDMSNAKRYWTFLQYSVESCMDGRHLTTKAIKDLLDYCKNWYTGKSKL